MDITAMSMGPDFLSTPPEEYFNGLWNAFPFYEKSDYSIELYIKVWTCHYDHTQLEKLLEIARNLNRRRE